MNPKISVVLPALLGYETVRAAIDAWDGQTCSEAIEILIIFPRRAGPTTQQREECQPNHVLVAFETADLNEARALGIARASADFIMLAEDHCLPDPDWTAAILERIADGWDGICPVLRPGTRTGAWPEGSFLIGYGQWMQPIIGGPVDVICGWNGVIRTQLLRDLGQELPEELWLGAFLVMRLKQAGARFYLEDRARMRHFDPPGWQREIYLLWLVGLGFGALRTKDWQLPLRLLYPAGFSAIALLHGKRAWTQYRRVGPAATVRPLSLPAAFILAGVWGVGEAMGAWLGPDRVTPHLWRTEVKPVCPEAVASSTELERLGKRERS